MPFELVDEVLAVTKTVQRRLRALPSRGGGVLRCSRWACFRSWAMRGCGRRLTAGLAWQPGLDLAGPSEKALRDLRRRLGPAPLKALFEVLAGPLAWPLCRPG